MSKQYLMLVEQENIGLFAKFMPYIKLLEVQGMDIGTSNAVKILVTPVVSPVPVLDNGLLSQQEALPEPDPIEEAVI